MLPVDVTRPFEYNIKPAPEAVGAGVAAVGEADGDVGDLVVPVSGPSTQPYAIEPYIVGHLDGLDVAALGGDDGVKVVALVYHRLFVDPRLPPWPI
jgi:hypothetical protein